MGVQWLRAVMVGREALTHKLGSAPKGAEPLSRTWRINPGCYGHGSGADQKQCLP
jgi:hypothetical protein